jgi:formylglycine-generating enzyme required for sulfatase activity
MKMLLVPSVILSLCCFAPGADDAADSKRTKLLQTFVEELVDIQPGQGKFPKSFRMGSKTGESTEQPVHEVTLTKPFAIARYEIPQNLYEAVMGENPSRWKGPRNSVEMMTFDDAVTFCEKLTGLLRAQSLIRGDELIRLPTEAEWEYCCRAGTTTEYSFGDAARQPDDVGQKASNLDAYAWHTGNAAGNDPPVGALKPNAWGLYDMHGYLWEFTSDGWSQDYAGAPADGSARPIAEGEPQKSQVVLRSGSWKNAYSDLRSSSRRGMSTAAKDDAVGLRCVKSRVEK